MKKLIAFIKKYPYVILISLCVALGVVSLVFRNATLDDDLYLWETNIMSEVLRQGKWIGNYAGGIHGFLFKLPLSILFLVTGPSLTLATIWNIILAAISIFLFYKILEEKFDSKVAFWGSFLLIFSFQFLLNLSSYMREIPMLFSVLFFFYLVMKKKNLWLIGLSMLLLLDSKEYIWIVLYPSFILSIWMDAHIKNKSIMETILECVKVSLPSLVFVILMIFTNVFPINMYLMSVIPGMTQDGLEYNVGHFDTEVATSNLADRRAVDLEDLESDNIIISFVFTIIKYASKFLYPRSFSFLSVPLIIFFPAFIYSFKNFVEGIRNKDFFIISICLFLYFFVAVFILRASFDRYLFPAIPFIMYFFIQFLQSAKKDRKFYIYTLLVSTILSLVSLAFELEYIWIKALLSFIVFLFLGSLLFVGKRFYEKYTYLLMLIISGITASVFLFFYAFNGQYATYAKWGNDYDIDRVVKTFDEDSKILINDPGWDLLIKVYRGDYNYNPEWRWSLSSWVPRKDGLKVLEGEKNFETFFKSSAGNRNFVKENGIEFIGIIESELEGTTFPLEDKLEDLREWDWVEWQESIELKNKTLHIFKVL